MILDYYPTVPVGGASKSSSQYKLKNRSALINLFSNENSEDSITFVADKLNDILSAVTSATFFPAVYLGDVEEYEKVFQIHQRINYSASSTTILLEDNHELFQGKAGKVLKYLLGNLDIPQLATELGLENQSDVVVWLEKNSVFRSLEKSGLLKSTDEDRVLDKLASVTASDITEIYNSDAWIRREVVASQRIESITVDKKDFE